MKKIILPILLSALITACATTKTTSKDGEKNGLTNTEKMVLEVTKFKLKPTADIGTFNKLDAQVEANFTSKQSGFISRQSAMDENGDYVVLVYWKTAKDATTSMTKFMNDGSVAEYASIIDGPSMMMSRYSVDKIYKEKNSEFVEVMSFKTNKSANIDEFNKANNKVETDITSKKTGFIKRITGTAENGEQIVAVYWDNKVNSDAALKPFMSNDIAKDFMGMMEQSSIVMVRSQMLSSKK